MLKARTQPLNMIATKLIQSGAPQYAVTANNAATNAKPVCVNTRILRRSNKSTMCPAGNANTITGNARAKPINPKLSGSLERSHTSHNTVVLSICKPNPPDNIPAAYQR